MVAWAEGDSCGARALRLRRGIADGEVVVHMQPEIRFDDDRVVGFEALARWDHPDHGMVPPDEFLPLAEATGVITDLERVVFDEACSHHTVLQACSPTPLWLAINLSSAELARTSVATTLTRCLHDAGINPEVVWVELTESGYAHDLTSFAQRVHELRELGLHVALDDFGTGWSSLTRLQQLPVDMIKIDRSFVRGLGIDRVDTEVVTALTRLAETLGLAVVAEGVETIDQRAHLAELHCDFGQGYLWSPALDIDSATAWLSERA